MCTYPASCSFYNRIHYAKKERIIPVTSTNTEGPITLPPEGTEVPVGVAGVEGCEEAVVDVCGLVIVEAPGVTVVEAEEVVEEVVELELSIAFL